MRTISYKSALNEALDHALATDPRVVLLGEDIGGYGGVFKVTEKLLEKHGPERVMDTPISESGFLGAALGMAAMGLRPVVEIMWVDFMLVGADPIINQIAKARYMSGGQIGTPLVIRTQGGGGRGNGAQHSQSLEALFCHVPGLKVVMPATPGDARGLLLAAIADEDPVIFIEHKMLYMTTGEVPGALELIPLGKAQIKRHGTDVTLLTWSHTLLTALQAADSLALEGVQCEVIDARSLVPFDIALVAKSLQKTHRLVIAHEACKSFGPGAEFAARIAEEYFDELDAPVVRVAVPDIPIPYAKPLEALVLPDVAAIVAAVRKVCQ